MSVLILVVVLNTPWLTGVLDVNRILLRFLRVVGVLLAFAAGVTQIVG